MSLTFEKYHGIGNDFLVVEVDNPEDITVQRGQRLCDRHFGVGGDGVLIVSPPVSGGARARMSVINADGSTPEMCGNGLRCVALYLARKAGEKETEFVIDTGAGPLSCSVSDGPDGALVGTEIGRGTPMGPIQSDIHNTSQTFFRLSTGNPHAICFHAPISPEELDIVGPRVSALIVGGANVEIATVKSATQIDLTVWERGVGRTLACGTGAAATAIEAVRQGKCPQNRPITVHLPGGPLQITVDESLSAYLRGPAEWVFSGTTQL